MVQIFLAQATRSMIRSTPILDYGVGKEFWKNSYFGYNKGNHIYKNK